jgi:hypothetical protein
MLLRLPLHLPNVDNNLTPLLRSVECLEVRILCSRETSKLIAEGVLWHDSFALLDHVSPLVLKLDFYKD